MTGRYAGLELLATAVLALDERLRVRYANPAAEHLLAIASRNLLGQQFPSLFAERAVLERALGDALQARWEYAAQNLNYERPGEEPLPLACVVACTDSADAPLVAELREYTQVIISEADRLQALMDRLLTPHRAPRCGR